MREIIIKKMINGGLGLAKDNDGMTVLVSGTLPDEKVIVKNVTEKRGYKSAEVKTIIQANPARREAACSWYGRCGGCDLMHSTYEYQLMLKKEIIEDLYSRQFGPEALQQCPVNAVLASPALFHYRQRIRLMVSDDAQIGYRQTQSHTVTPIDSCLIAHDLINDALSGINASQTVSHFIGLSREIELQWNPATNLVSLIFHFHRKPRPADSAKAAELLREMSIIENVIISGDTFQSVVINREKSTTAPTLGFTFLPGEGKPPINVQWEAGAFCQVNIEQNFNMIATVLDFAAIQPHETVLDLYCGMGNFALPLARQAASVEGMEGQGASIRCARANSERNGVSNTLFTKTDIYKGCSGLIKENRSFDCVIVDPPRAGIPDLYDQLSALTQKRLVYVSCDPATLFRDLHHLTEHGFTIKKVQPVDMFPQTHHIETVVLLEKN